MAVAIPPEVQEFLRGRVIAHLATVNRDGSPQVTPLWADTDGTHVVLNTSRGRVKVANMNRDPRVALSVSPYDDPHKVVFIWGKTVQITEEGAVEHMHSLYKRYRGLDQAPVRQSVVRLKVFISPDKIVARGG